MNSICQKFGFDFRFFILQQINLSIMIFKTIQSGATLVDSNVNLEGDLGTKFWVFHDLECSKSFNEILQI